MKLLYSASQILRGFRRFFICTICAITIRANSASKIEAEEERIWRRILLSTINGFYTAKGTHYCRAFTGKSLILSLFLSFLSSFKLHFARMLL